MACILDFCWPRSCNIVFSIISILVCLTDIILASVYHTAWIPIVMASIVLLAAVAYLVISIEDRVPSHLDSEKDCLQRRCDFRELRYGCGFRMGWLAFVVITALLAFGAFERLMSLTAREDWR